MTLVWSGVPVAGHMVPPWSGVQAKPGRVTVMPSPPVGAPVSDKRIWTRFEVRHGDLIGSDTTRERAQVIGNLALAARGNEGVSVYTPLTVMFDKSYAPPAKDAMPQWNIFHQWFSEPGQAPFNYEVDALARTVIVTASTGTDPNHPLQHKFTICPLSAVLGVPLDLLPFYVWSDKPSVGRYGLWARVGNQAPKCIVSPFAVQTLYAPKDMATRPMVGWYRHIHAETDVMYQTGLTIHTDYAGAIKAFAPGWPTTAP